MNAKTVFCIVAVLCLILPAAAEQPTSVVAVFHIREGKVTPVSSTIVYGGSPNPFLESGEFIVATSAAGGSYQNQAWMEDPRVNTLLDVVEGEPSAVVRDDVDFTVILPFRDDTAKVAVYNKDRKVLAETDLSGAKNAFCMAHPVDERCQGTVAMWGIGILLVVAIAGSGAYLVLKRRKGGA
jgi:hypothetical protein